MILKFYTDGACSGNPGVGGWAWVCVGQDNSKVKTDYGSSQHTTNNEMELMAVFRSFLWCKARVDKDKKNFVTRVEILSDSAYVVNSFKLGWLKSWSKNGWVNAKGEPIKNMQLWKDTHEIVGWFKKRGIDVTFVKVKGHAGNPMNSYADELAVRATKERNEI